MGEISTQAQLAVADNDESSNAANSPGQRLKAARLQRGLTEEEVAESLLITRHYLRAIEEDDYERLPGEVFARGYVRNYCLLIDVPTEPLMTVFESIVEATRREKAARGTPKRALTRADRNQRWLGVSLFVFVSLFGVLWFFNG